MVSRQFGPVPAVGERGPGGIRLPGLGSRLGVLHGGRDHLRLRGAPHVADFGGFLAYKGGQLFFHFVETTYGKGTVTRLIQTLNEMRDLNAAFKKVTKTSLEEAGEIWLRELRFIYWPELGQRKYGKSVARQLTDHGRDQSFYNLQPSISPNGEEIAFFSDRESWEAIYILNVKSEKVTRSVIQGGKGEKHESFHSFKSRHRLEPGQQAPGHRQQEPGQGRHPHRRRQEGRGEAGDASPTCRPSCLPTGRATAGTSPSAA